ncbi:MAG: hypothetical protein HY700_20795 [Gemmatimonadetes bacterium]|nr:hypothetical protein [Gemmatimonadota bacterium]
MTRSALLVGVLGFSMGAAPGAAQTISVHPAPGAQQSRNVKLIAHLPMGGPFYSNDVEFEQEASRPYVYVSGRSHYGFKVVSTKDVNRVQEIYRWTIKDPQVHVGRATAPAYFKIGSRYYLVQSFQFRQGGADGDLGAVVMDMTGLPDTSTVKEVAQMRYPEYPGGFHEIYSYKHSDGRALLFAQVSAPWVNVYDMAKVAAGDKAGSLAGKVANPTSMAAGTSRGYHDMYVGYDPVSKQDRFFGAGGGGYYVYDVTNLAEPKLITSATGVAGLQNGHTFTPTPDGRYAVLESEYRYAPLRIIDLKPGYDGTVKTISRPIGAYTTRWDGLPHNHEVRWPYVFISHYEDGLRVINMMDPTNPYEVGFYDTYDGPIQLNKSLPFEPPTPGRGSEQNGADGVDVRNWDGMIAIGDLYTGLWLFKMDGFDGWNGHQWGMPNQSSVQDWDNGPDGAPKASKVS